MLRGSRQLVTDLLRGSWRRRQQVREEVTKTGAIVLNFGVLGDIADIITHAKFYVNRFRDFRVLTPQILPFSIGLAGRPYNSVSTTVLHCETFFGAHSFDAFCILIKI